MWPFLLSRFLQSLDDQLEDPNSPIWNVDFDLKTLPDPPSDDVEVKSEAGEAPTPEPSTSGEPAVEATGTEATITTTTIAKLDPLTVKTDTSELSGKLIGRLIFCECRIIM